MIRQFGLTAVALVAGLQSCSSDASGGLINIGSGGKASDSPGVGGSEASTGGSSYLGGQSGLVLAAGSAAVGGGTGSSAASGTSPAANCPVWPREKLFPLVGVLFYGPNRGPCKSSMNLGYEYVFTYDASGSIIGSVETSRSVVTTTYTYEQGLLVASKSSGDDGEATTSYRYGPGTAGYTYTSPLGRVYRYEYMLDSLGYPLGMVPYDGAAIALPFTRSVYEYENCRIKRRVAYQADGSVNGAGTFEYQYDGAGRVISMKSDVEQDTYDYSCW